VAHLAATLLNSTKLHLHQLVQDSSQTEMCFSPTASDASGNDLCRTKPPRAFDNRLSSDSFPGRLFRICPISDLA
jgi:hypothetical protein